MKLLNIFQEEVERASITINSSDRIVATNTTFFYYAYAVCEEGIDRNFMLFIDEKSSQEPITYDTYFTASASGGQNDECHFTHNIKIFGFSETKLRLLLRYLLSKKEQCFDVNWTDVLIDVDHLKLTFT